MGYYNWRITGAPWRLPQQLDRETYAVAPYFPWQAPRPVPNYHHEVMKDFYLGVELPQYEDTRTPVGLMKRESARAAQVWMFYVQPLFTFPLIVAVCILPHGFSWRQIGPGTRFLLLATAFGLAGYALEVFYNPHYPAPGTCLVFALVLSAMRDLRGWTWRQKPVGRAVARAVPLVATAMLAFSALAVPRLLPRAEWPAMWTYPGWQMPDRARILARLEREPGAHVVIVRYSIEHNSRLEWVYNHADIDASKVVWARDMGREKNRELLNYYPDRKVWLVEPDAVPVRLVPYPAE
jgi:hypothetical protein